MIDYTIVLEISKIMLISYTISRFEPLKMVLDLLPDKLLFNLIALLLTCSKCISFWSGLFLFNIWVGMIASLIMTILEKTLLRWLERTRLN